jgi:hypothetical protein
MMASKDYVPNANRETSEKKKVKKVKMVEILSI